MSVYNKREADGEDDHEGKRLKTDEVTDRKKEENVMSEAQELDQTDSDPQADDNVVSSMTHLSKKQRRKLEKLQRWTEGKMQRRARERERVKRNRMIAKMNNITLGPSRQALKKSTMAQSKCKTRIVVDLSFDDLMSDLAIGKCVKQLLRCYSLNRRAENPMQLYFTNFNGKVEEEMEKHEGYKNWDIYFRSDSYTEIFDKSELVYLTSESDNVITKLEDNKVYIIGGLVDHNAHKGVCYRVAIDQKIGHGQLPLAEYLNMKTRKVLTIDHVFEILLCVSAGMNWKEAFLKVLPPRKGAVEKEVSSNETTETTLIKEEKLPGIEEEKLTLIKEGNLDDGTFKTEFHAEENTHI